MSFGKTAEFVRKRETKIRIHKIIFILEVILDLYIYHLIIYLSVYQSLDEIDKYYIYI